MVTTVSELTSAAVSDRGLSDSRPQNEDSFLELPQHGLFAVADGVGGAQAGEVASQMAVEILAEAFVNLGMNSDPEDTMRIAIERANEAIYRMSRDIPQLSSMATTLAAVHISGDMATIAHVGDSRVYRVDGNGRLFRETDDHSVVEEEVRAGRMTPEQALNHPSRNVISRALGAEETVLPDIKCVLVHPGTTFLLCSDGITRHIGDPEIETLLNSEFGPEDICARMKEICFSRGAEDNLTAVVLRFPGERQSLTPVEPGDDEDIEEVTVAGVRAPFDDEADTDEDIRIPADAYSADSVTEPTVSGIDSTPDVVENGHDESYLIEEPEPSEEIVVTAERPEPPAAPAHFESSPVPAARPGSISYDSAAEPASAASGLGRILPALLFLAAGLIVGTGIGYFLLAPKQQTRHAETPVLPVQQSDNVQLTSFENRRRIVDEDPAKYLNARAATPQEADDFFWLGRALLLTGKPVEARRQFEEARTRLASFDDRTSARTMANEIAMALAILDSPAATERFAGQIAAANASNSANANSNSPNNAIVPVR